MRSSIASIGRIHPRHALPVVFALGALILGSAPAHADDPEKVDVITVTAPAVKIVGRESATGAPIQEMTVSVRVKFDPVTLTTNSGVALLKDSVVEAAQKACGASLTEDGAAVSTMPSPLPRRRSMLPSLRREAERAVESDMPLRKRTASTCAELRLTFVLDQIPRADPIVLSAVGLARSV